MKRWVLFIAIMALVIFSSCKFKNAFENAEEIIASAEINEQWQVTAIVLYKGNLKNENEMTGEFCVAAINAAGEEVCRYSLNEIYAAEELTMVFAENSALRVRDYNNDRIPDIAIGFPARDGSGEYKYTIFSFYDDGNILIQPVKGYKEDGFIHSVNCGNFAELRASVGVGMESAPGVLAGIHNGAAFIPARYTWTGSEFSFVLEEPFVIPQDGVPNEYGYTVSIIQTRFLKPMAAYEKDFSIYKSYILGSFDAVVTDKNDLEISRLNINSLFLNREIGWAGTFPLAFEDYNGDGNYEFAVGQALDDSPEFQYVLISIDDEGVLSRVNVTGYKDEGYIYNSNEDAAFRKVVVPYFGIEVTLNNGGWSKGYYYWQDNMFRFRNGVTVG